MHNHLQLPTLPAWLALLICLLPLTASGQGIDLTADHIARDEKGGVTASGNVLMRRGDETLQTDKLLYDPAKKRLEAHGHVVIRSRQATIEAESGDMDTESKRGELQNATITLPNGETLKARRIERLSDAVFDAEDPRFTACPPDQEAWSLAAASARLDQDEGTLTATHGRFRMGPVPVLYSPYWQHPLRRKSGFLMPDVGSGKRRGTEWALPYFWAPAPNWDVTLTPHWMTERGFKPEVEYRLVAPRFDTRLNVEAIRDKVTGRNRHRGSGSLDADLPWDMRLQLSGDNVSDRDYLADYARDAATASVRYLQSTANLSWQGESADWQLSSRHLQDLTLASNAATLQVVPQFESGIRHGVFGNRMQLHLDQVTTRYANRTDTDDLRLDVHPYVEIPWDIVPGGLSVTFSGGSRHTQYWLHDPRDKSRFTRTSGEFSVEARAIFERFFGDEQWRHTIEPTVRYSLVNVKDQTDFPNFDSGFGGLTLTTLLSDNRFSGFDRIESVNRVGFMLTSRLQAQDSPSTGLRDLARMSLGTLVSIRRRNIDQNLKTAPSQPLSNLFGELQLNPAAGLSMHADAQLNTSQRFWAATNASLNWSSAIHFLALGYQFSDSRFAGQETQSVQVDARFWLTRRWQVRGGTNFDVLLNIAQHASAGVFYQHPCWNFLLEGYRINRPSGSSKAADVGFRFLIGFKGLGSLGS